MKVKFVILILFLLFAGLAIFLIGFLKSGKEVVNIVSNINIPEIGVNLPVNDVEGEDLSNVPRYQPSVRLRYMQDDSDDGIFVNILYYTKDEIKDVLDFYLNEMPNYNWKLVRRESSSGLSFLNFQILNSQTFHFVPQDCNDEQECSSDVNISIGGFQIKDNKYTMIYINYHNRTQSNQQSSDLNLDNYNNSQKQVAHVSPTSETGEAFNQFIQSIISAINQEQATLTSYNEYNLFGQFVIEVQYTLSSSINDVSQAVKAIRQALSDRGISDSAMSSNVSTNEGVIQILYPQKFANQTVDIIAITIRRNSDIVEVTGYSGNQ